MRCFASTAFSGVLARSAGLTEEETCSLRGLAFLWEHVANASCRGTEVIREVRGAW